MKISFIIPCYNSEHMLEGVVQEIMETMKNVDFEIVLVNDCSPDNTFKTIKRLCASDSRIIGINMAKNFGQHAALMAGYKVSTGEIIVSLDDDGQTPANEVWSLIDKLNEGYDVVYASYEEKKHSKFRNWGSKVNKKMSEMLIEKPKDVQVTSYFAMRRFVMKEMLKYHNAYPYVSGLVFRCTKNIANVPVRHRDRVDGSSGYSIRKLLALWMNGFTAFSVKPLRIATILGIVVALVGFVVTVYTVIHKLLNPAVPLGWSSLFAAIFLVGGCIMFMLGMIGEYVGRIYISINNAPQYVIRDIVNYKEADDEK